jgi:hypothetical protein
MRRNLIAPYFPVFTAHEGTTRTAQYAVVHAGCAGRNECGARVGHGAQTATARRRWQSDHCLDEARQFRNRGGSGFFERDALERQEIY